MVGSLGYHRHVVEQGRVLAELAQRPDDADLRAHAARLLAASGDHQRAIALLQERLIHFNAHGDYRLPCLCRSCLVAAEVVADCDGESFVRDFAASAGKVLFYWLPAELADDRAAVAERVGRRLRAQLESPSSREERGLYMNQYMLARGGGGFHFSG